MKKLTDIPKRNIFEVPEGYFDKLPGVIQSRVAEREKAPSWTWSWGLALRYAVPVLCIAAGSLFWFRTHTPPPLDLQAELSRFEPEELQEYIDQHEVLSDADLSTDDLVESVKWKKGDVDQLEKSVYSGYGTSQQEIQKVLDDYEL